MNYLLASQAQNKIKKNQDETGLKVTALAQIFQSYRGVNPNHEHLLVKGMGLPMANVAYLATSLAPMTWAPSYQSVCYF